MGIKSEKALTGGRDVYYQSKNANPLVEPVELKKLYLVKGLLETIHSIEDGSVTIIKQDKRIIQVNVKENLSLT